MNQVRDIIETLRTTLYGHPWYGKSIIKILEETDPRIVDQRPGPSLPTANELLYHMLNWAEFTLNSLISNPAEEVSTYEANDRRRADPIMDRWETGLSRFITINQLIIEVLKIQDDRFLDNSVRSRDYNIGFLVSGLIQHHIYHAGQIALLNKKNS